MSHPSPELILEVSIFERLEQMTTLTLGQLTQLRVQSRAQQVNLLFLAFERQCIDAMPAKMLAIELGVDVGRAPWNSQPINSSELSNSVSSTLRHIDAVSESDQGSEHQLPDRSSMSGQIKSAFHSSSDTRPFKKRKRRFSERPSLTAAVDQAIALNHISATPSSPTVMNITTPTTLSMSSTSAEVRREKKRSFSELELKTEIEINLPSSLDEMIHASPEYVTPKVTNATWDEEEIVLESSDEDLDQTDEHDAQDPTLNPPEDTLRSLRSEPISESERSPLASTTNSASLHEGPSLDEKSYASSMVQGASRWSQPIWSAVHHHLGVPLYIQHRTDMYFRRNVAWVSRSPIDDAFDQHVSLLTSYPQTPAESLPDTLKLSYQQLNRIPCHHALPTLYEILSPSHHPNPQDSHVLVYQRSLPQGVCLAELMHTAQPPNASQIYLSLSAHQIFWQLALQVQIAHQHQVAHLAIDPHALWYERGTITLNRWEWCQSSTTGLPHLLRASAPSASQEGYAWVAPELRACSTSEMDLLRADVYSLAATAYWLYTGSPPSLQPDETRALLQQHFRGQHELLVDGLINALSTDPGQRPAHAGALLATCVQQSITVNHLVDFYRALYSYPIV